VLSSNCFPIAVSSSLQELEEEWDKAKPLLKEVLRAAGWSATADSSYEGYLEALAAWQQQQQDAVAADGEWRGLWQEQGFADTAVDCVWQQQRAPESAGSIGATVVNGTVADGACRVLRILVSWQLPGMEGMCVWQHKRSMCQLLGEHAQNTMLPSIEAK
jgi:CheY-like chemotaxis protein